MATPRAKEILKKLTTYQLPVPDKAYTDNPDSGEFNVDRWANGEAFYWEKTEIGEVTLAKKLIISDWSQRFVMKETNKTIEAFWKFILSQNVECYVWTGELTRVDDINSLMREMNNVEIIHPTDLQHLLTNHGISKDESEVIDYLRAIQLGCDFQSFIPGFYQQNEFNSSFFNDIEKNILQSLFNTLKGATINDVIINDETSQEVLKLLPSFITDIRQLAELTIDDEELSIDDVITLLKSSPANTKVNITRTPINLYYKKSPEKFRIQEMKKIKKVLIEHDDMTNNELLELFHYLPSITDLNINSCENITADIFKSSIFPHVEKLRISNCQKLFSGMMEQSYNKLVDFSLSGSTLTDKQLSTFLSRCPRLRIFHLMQCNHITGDFLYNEAVNLNSLTSMSLGYLKFETSKRGVIHLRSLEKMRIRHFTASSELFSELLSHCNNLLDLDMFNYTCTNNEIFKIRHPLDKLKSLRISGTEITDTTLLNEQLNNLMPYCPNVETILYGDNKENNGKEITLSPCISENVTHLKMNGSTTMDVLSSFSVKFPNLKKITSICSEIKVTSAFPLFKNVIELDYRSVENENSVLELWLENCPNIAKLNLHYIKGKVSSYRGISLDKLIELKCHSVTNLDSEKINNILSLCPHPVKLSLSQQVWGNTNDLLWKLNLEKIREIDVEQIDFNVANTDIDYLAELLSRCPHCTELNLDLIQFKDAFFEKNYSFKQITHLQVSNYHRQSQIKEFVTFFPNLESIVIPDSTILVNNYITLLCPAIKNITLTDDDIIYDWKIAEFEKTHPNIKIYYGSTYKKPLNTKSGTIDTNTQDTNQTLHAKQIFAYKQNENPYPNIYREQVHTALEIGKEIKYSSKEYPVIPISLPDEKDPGTVYYEKYHSTPDIYYGEMILPLNQENWFNLVSLSPEEKILGLSANAALELGYCHEKGLHCVRPMPSQNINGHIQVCFMIQSTRRIFDTDIPTPLIPYQLLKFSEDGKLERSNFFYQIKHQLHSLSMREKVASLAKFCQSFSFSQEKLKESYANDIDKLNTLISNAKGVCRHSALVFLALAQQFGITARIPRNSIHLFADVLIDDKWYYLNVGGASGRLKIQPMRKFTPLMEFTPNKKNEMNIDKVRIKHALELENTLFNTWDTMPSNAKNMDDYCQEILAAAIKLPLGKKNILIMIDSDQIEIFHSNMTKALSHKNKFYYLHDLKDVNEKQAIVVDGRIKKIKSNLMTFIQHAQLGDALISNWSDYKSAYVGHNTMMELDGRKLKSQLIPDVMSVIAILDKSKADEMGDDFYSRFRITSTCPDFPEKKDFYEKLQLKKDDDTNDFEIAEFYDSEWKNFLTGKITIHGNSFSIEEGILTKALRENKRGLLLINAPFEKIEFRLFITELLHRIPEHFAIKAISQDLMLKSDFVKAAQDVDQDNIQLLNSQTFKYYFKSRRCENGLLYYPEGRLAHYANQSITVYVTETLPSNNWTRLIREAENHHCTLKLKFAQHVQFPEGMLHNTASFTTSIAIASNAHMIITNDLELSEEETFDENPQAFVVSINEKTEFCHLIERAVQKNGELAFESVIGDVWKALQNGKTIVLKGTLSPTLARQLESLFLSTPHLWVNGERQYHNGKLIILTDKDNPLSYVNAEERKYSEADYWNRLDKINQSNAGYANFKHSYYQFKNFATQVQFSYVQLRTMAEKIRNGNLSNPFKPFFRMNSKHVLLELAKRSWVKQVKIKNSDSMKKRHEKIHEELKVSSYVFVVGLSGIGKSTSILQLKEYGYVFHVGIENIKQFLNAHDANMHILFIDEANLERDGSWDILEGIFNKTPGILIDGQFHPLSPNKKIIFSGNFSDYAGRHQHRFFDRHGQVITFKEMPDDVLTSIIIQPALNALFPDMHEKERDELNAILLRSYHEINTQIANHPFTPRNLKMICLRLCELLKYHADFFNEDYQFAIKIAILDEADSLLDEQQKIKFMEWLNLDETDRMDLIRKIHQKNIPSRLGNLIITESRREPVRIMQQMFNIRNMILNNTHLADFGIPNLLIEGLSGIGKSGLAIECLKAAIMQENRYSHLTPTDPEKMQTILLNDLYEGCVAIIDELNSLPLERFMNQLLSGYDMNGVQHKKGFAVIGTQNPINFKGRQILSTAFENRFWKFHLKDYPEHELREIVTQICQDANHANHIVDIYITKKNYAALHNKKPPPTPRHLFAYTSGVSLK